MRYFLILIALIILLSSCITDPSSSKFEVIPEIDGVYIVNEGSWGENNSSISFYSLEDGTIQNSIYFSINNEHLGDLANSMYIVDTLGFIVVNGSNKVDVISTESWKRITSINLPDGSSPRHFLAVNDKKGYITTYGNSCVTILDLEDYSISGTISVGSNPEQMVKVNDKVYVANSGWGYDNTVSVIDIYSETVIKTVTVGDNPITMFVDKDNEINVLCTGNYAYGDTTTKETNGSISIINSSTDAVVDSFEIIGHPTRITYDGDETGYYINGSKVVSYSTSANKVLNDTLIIFEGGIIYGLSADPQSDVLYLLNAGYFASNGEFIIYTKEGVEQNRLDVGMIPGSFAYSYK